MSNSKNLPQISENNTQIYKQNKEVLGLSIALAFERTNTPPFDINKLTQDVLEEFKKQDIKIITTAIKKGSLGAFGKTYKLSTQEVCIWIREYLKTYKPKPVKNQYPNSTLIPKP